MTIKRSLSALTTSQGRLVAGSFLGCATDAFDFFALVFAIRDIGQEFATSIKVMTIAILLTIAMRPIGALLFKLAADRYGRRPMLTLDMLLFASIEIAAGLTTSLVFFLFLRAAYGVAMGGEWRLGATFSMNIIPSHTRGVVGGILQSGYPVGYLVAASALLTFYPAIGWRGMFMMAGLPALLVLGIRRRVDEPPGAADLENGGHRQHLLDAIDGTLAMIVWGIVLITALNFFGRGTADIFPRFIATSRDGIGNSLVMVAAAYNVMAAATIPVLGALAEKIGNRRAVLFAVLIELPVIPIWVFSVNPSWLATSALLVQYAIFSLQSKVHGAWFRSRLISR